MYDVYQGVTFCQIILWTGLQKFPPTNSKVGAKSLFWLVGGQ
jgi:hypothetical protein